MTAISTSTVGVSIEAVVSVSTAVSPMVGLVVGSSLVAVAVTKNIGKKDSSYFYVEM